MSWHSFSVCCHWWVSVHGGTTQRLGKLVCYRQPRKLGISLYCSQNSVDMSHVLCDKKEMATMCDIMSHLNHLNLQLQGKNHTATDVYEAVETFWSRLKLSTSSRPLWGKCKIQGDPDMNDLASSLAKTFKDIFIYILHTWGCCSDGGLGDGNIWFADLLKATTWFAHKLVGITGKKSKRFGPWLDRIGNILFLVKTNRGTLQ